MSLSELLSKRSTGSRAALCGATLRPQSHPYLADMGAPCVLASHSPIAPRQRVVIPK